MTGISYPFPIQFVQVQLWISFYCSRRAQGHKGFHRGDVLVFRTPEEYDELPVTERESRPSHQGSVWISQPVQIYAFVKEASFRAFRDGAKKLTRSDLTFQLDEDQIAKVFGC